jgi:hypothetical protein
MTTQTVRTHCPNCGAALKRPDLSLCAYCATPLQLGGKDATARDEVVQRLLRLREHAQFAELSGWSPRDLEHLARARRWRGLAALAFGIAIACGGVGWARIGASGAVVWVAIAAAWAALSVFFFAAMLAEKKRELERPMLRRPALVVERRSETMIKRGGHATLYYFTLRFDDGSEGEFRWPGQGTLYDPLANGMTGLAFTRGEKLIEFKRL